MKVPFHVVQARRERLAQLIAQHRYLPVRELCRQLGVSEATARRDLASLVREKKVTRTYGGALAEFNDRFPSFRERRHTHVRAKSLIAGTAASLLQPGGTYFLDSGTTIFALAERFRHHPTGPLTIVTSNIPVGETLATLPEVQVFQLAGQLLGRQSVLLGETARRSLEFWQFDLAFLSAEGMDARGLWNSEAPIVDQQLAAIRRAKHSIFCLDGAKLQRGAPCFLLPWPDVDRLLTELPYEKLTAANIPLPPEKYLRATGKAAPLPPPQSQAPETSALPVHFL